MNILADIGYWLSITNASQEAGYFDNSPPWYGFIPLLLGAIGVSWGWIDIHRKYPHWVSGFVFFAGIILAAYGFFLILPWGVR